MTQPGTDSAALRHPRWKEQADIHRDEGYGTTCDACLFITEMYDLIVDLEGERDRLREALDGLVDQLDDAEIAWSKNRELDKLHEAARAALAQSEEAPA